MARVSGAKRESVPEDQKSTFDRFVKEEGGVPTGGPYSVMLNVPELVYRAQHFNSYLRNQSTLSPLIQELAMLTTAREMDCQYVWNAHVGVGRKVGLRDELVDAMRDKRELTGLTAEEAAVVNYGREMHRTRRVSEDIFNKALAQFGTRGLLELTSLMGYYALLAFNLNAFQVEVPPGGTEPILPL